MAVVFFEDPAKEALLGFFFPLKLSSMKKAREIFPLSRDYLVKMVRRFSVMEGFFLFLSLLSGRRKMISPFSSHERGERKGASDPLRFRRSPPFFFVMNWVTS